MKALAAATITPNMEATMVKLSDIKGAISNFNTEQDLLKEVISLDQHQERIKSELSHLSHPRGNEISKQSPSDIGQIQQPMSNFDSSEQFINP
jgi:hypothetical protein